MRFFSVVGCVKNSWGSLLIKAQESRPTIVTRGFGDWQKLKINFCHSIFGPKRPTMDTNSTHTPKLPINKKNREGPMHALAHKEPPLSSHITGIKACLSLYLSRCPPLKRA